MHELSIALSIIEQIEEQTADLSGSVKAVHLKVGVLSGVDCDALRFAYEIASAGTPLEGSVLEIETITMLTSCPVCGEEYKPSPQELFCPRCITPPQRILQGKELELTALEMEA